MAASSGASDAGPEVRIVLVVLGGVALLIGAVWIGQGLNLIPGSFMTGNRTWFYIGLLVACWSAWCWSCSGCDAAPRGPP